MYFDPVLQLFFTVLIWITNVLRGSILDIFRKDCKFPNLLKALGLLDLGIKTTVLGIGNETT